MKKHPPCVFSGREAGRVEGCAKRKDPMCERDAHSIRKSLAGSGPLLLRWECRSVDFTSH